MLALIDGDIVAYRCAASTVLEGDQKVPAPWGIVRARCDEMIHGILGGCGPKTYKVWLSGDRNFRYDLYPQYKANRKAPRPPYLEDLKEYLVVEWGARVAAGIEADDAIGIDATAEPSIICSIDKDLRQVPGWHYNFVKDVIDHVTEEEGLLSFYRSMLIGDTSDNVRGVEGIGPVKAARRVPAGLSEREMFEAVLACFAGDVGRFLLVGDLLYIQRREGDKWSERVAPWISPGQYEPAVEAKSTNYASGSTDESSDSTKDLLISTETTDSDGIRISGTTMGPSSTLIIPDKVT